MPKDRRASAASTMERSDPPFTDDARVTNRLWYPVPPRRLK